MAARHIRYARSVTSDAGQTQRVAVTAIAVIVAAGGIIGLTSGR